MVGASANQNTRHIAALIPIFVAMPNQLILVAIPIHINNVKPNRCLKFILISPYSW